MEATLLPIKSGLEESKPARIVMRGSGGLGKTTLALYVLYQPELEACFEDRTFCVPCEAALSPFLLVSAINRTLKLPQGRLDPLQQLRGYFQSCDKPILVVLDNFETLWLGEDHDRVKQVLALLGSILEAAREHLTRSGRRYSLKLVDMVPLAVTLMASAAQLGDFVSNLRRAWEDKSKTMLSTGDLTKATNIEVSIRISFDSKPMQENSFTL
jgi:hypothetical protein